MAARPAHPESMMPSRPGPTRTAPPQRRPGNRRMVVYTLFGLTGFVYLLVSFVALRLVWNLGSGAEAWAAVMQSMAHPLYLAFHALALVSVVFVAVRFFGLFPKAQPARIGPLKPPPAAMIDVGLYLAWIGVTIVFSAVLAGVIF